MSSTPVESFRKPRFDAPVDLEAHLRLLPEGASCRGMFITDLLDHASKVAPGLDLPAAAGIPPRRYVAFFDYPYADVLRLVHAATDALYRGIPRGEALRRIGQRAYPTMLQTHAGRVVFGALGVDVDKVLEYGPKGYRLAINFGRVSSERLGDRHFTYSFEALPGFLETYQIGIIEGALHHYGARGQILIAMKDLAHATLDVRW